jgi:formylglycine-generating enzyme required for sulfatase activity
MRPTPEIGNLPNPANDARLVAQALGAAGFQVATVIDADQKTMKRAISHFGKQLTLGGSDSVGLFYYAGHGVQIGGGNYLIPLRAELQSEADVEIDAVDAQWVLKQMEFAGNRVNIVILDACRNNPLARSLRSATRGLARMDAPTGSFIGYSTAPGETAADGAGGNSPYSAALAAEIAGPAVPIEELFRNVRVKVMAATKGQQVPWDSSSLTGAFYFRAPAVESAAPVVATALAPAAATAAPTQSAARGQGEAAAIDAAAPPGSIFRDCADCPELIVVPAGRFTMGSPDDEDGHNADETPPHKVTIARPFALMTHEITRDQFAAFVTETGHEMKDGGCYLADGGEGKMDEAADWLHPGFAQTGDHPAVCVSWQDAHDYAEWLGNKTGKTYRLPSEAEWEYAARAGRTTAWPWTGDDLAAGCAVANGFDQDAKKQLPINEPLPCIDGFVFTAPVGSFPANRFGLTDMIGNVWEWVEDCHKPDYRNAPADGKVWEKADCKDRVTRGGAWLENPWDLRFARRYPVEPDGRENIIGFRLARGL